MTTRPLACIVLAAGKGTRMKSSLTKVMHPVAGRPMLGHVLDVASSLSPETIVVVVGPGMEAVTAFAAPHQTVIQAEQRGTGHAAACARETLAGFAGDVLIIFADHPLFTHEPIRRLVDARTANGANHAVVMLGMRPTDPRAYGRLITGPDGLERIVEAKDATPEELAVDLVWAGVMVADGAVLFDLLDRLDDNNAQGEFYLPYIVQKARQAGRTCGIAEVSEIEAAGVNSRAELAQAEAVVQGRLRARAMAEGATLQDPATTYFSMDTELGRDVTVGPNVYFGPGVSVGDNVQIKSFSHIEGAIIDEGAIIGPFARIRPKSIVGQNVLVGNFVELKNTRLEKNAKAKHFTYLGDTTLGEGANIGAGTIVCNYDGYDKFKTDIGAGAFVGSNSTLLPPLKIGDGAFVAAGSVITGDVEPDAMAFGRALQVNKPGKAAKFREAKQKLK